MNTQIGNAVIKEQYQYFIHPYQANEAYSKRKSVNVLIKDEIGHVADCTVFTDAQFHSKSVCYQHCTSILAALETGNHASNGIVSVKSKVSMMRSDTASTGVLMIHVEIHQQNAQERITAIITVDGCDDVGTCKDSLNRIALRYNLVPEYSELE